jgi:hypothetical protein
MAILPLRLPRTYMGLAVALASVGFGCSSSGQWQSECERWNRQRRGRQRLGWQHRNQAAQSSGSLLTVYTEVTGKGGTVEEATQFAVNAIFDSPSFLYRTEFGASAAEGPLTPYELASQLSYFVTDGPPDDQLLAAAAQNMLSTPETCRKTARACSRAWPF